MGSGVGSGKEFKKNLSLCLPGFEASKGTWMDPLWCFMTNKIVLTQRRGMANITDDYLEKTFPRLKKWDNSLIENLMNYSLEEAKQR